MIDRQLETSELGTLPDYAQMTALLPKVICRLFAARISMTQDCRQSMEMAIRLLFAWQAMLIFTASFAEEFGQLD